MNLTVATTRVYGTTDQYGEEPRTTLPGTPITLDDYPSAGSKGDIYLGAIPEEVIEAERGRRALGRMMLKALVGEWHDDQTPDARFDEALREIDRELLLDDYNWYVTLVLRQEIEVSDDEFSTLSYAFSKEAWLRDDERRAAAKQALDVLATIVSVWDAELLDRVVLNDRSLFFAEGKRPAGAPVFEGAGAEGRVTRGEESVRRLADRVALLQSVDLSPFAREGWLAGSAHWRVQSLLERDPWKRFLWSFVGLEVITNKLFERYRTGVVTSLRLADGEPRGATPKDGPEMSQDLPLDELVWAADRTPLAAKFTVVALALFPEAANEEVALFRDLKRARDRLAHGSLQAEHEVPVAQAVDLLGRVMTAAVGRIVFESDGGGRG